MNEDIDFLRFPIGKFVAPDEISDIQRATWITSLENFPRELSDVAGKLNDEQLDTPYRPGGWTIRQVVHHLPDSHLNAYTRFKLTVTEESPTVRPYDQDGWAMCEEALSGPVSLSLPLLEALHIRWAAFLKTLTEADFNRCYIHPEHNSEVKLKEALGMYVWHSYHHLAHITETIKRNSWQI